MSLTLEPLSGVLYFTVTSMSLTSFRSPLSVWLCIALAIFLPLRSAMAMTLGNGCSEHQMGLQQHERLVGQVTKGLAAQVMDHKAMQGTHNTMPRSVSGMADGVMDDHMKGHMKGHMNSHMDCCDDDGVHAHDCSHCNHCASATVVAIPLPSIWMEFVATVMDADTLVASAFRSRTNLPLLQPPVFS